jgi:hypothetical protein
VDQMSVNDIRMIVHAEMEAMGIPVPVELKFDYSFIEGAENVAKTKKFIKLCNGNLSNCLYVSKAGARYDDPYYFDLLFVVDENGRPFCLPIPLARRLFGVGMIQSCDTKGVIQGYMYEYIYKAYYEHKNDGDLPF